MKTEYHLETLGGVSHQNKLRERDNEGGVPMVNDCLAHFARSAGPAVYFPMFSCIF